LVGEKYGRGLFSEKGKGKRKKGEKQIRAEKWLGKEKKKKGGPARATFPSGGKDGRFGLSSIKKKGRKVGADYNRLIPMEKKGKKKKRGGKKGGQPLILANSCTERERISASLVWEKEGGEIKGVSKTPI